MFSNLTNRAISRRAPSLKSISIIESNSEAEIAAKEILALTKNVPFIGFDCEGQNPTALLQIAVFDKDAPDGFRCYLFRLSQFNPESSMPNLRKLLNSDVIKLGVSVDIDIKRLTNDGYIAPGHISYFDLRFLGSHPLAHEADFHYFGTNSAVMIVFEMVPGKREISAAKPFRNQGTRAYRRKQSGKPRSRHRTDDS